ncbi:hypothetical protein MM1S1540310_2052 [Mycobacteroides abscessus subsp. bolletii 1S-154-0310]|nr:hypothetical protein MM1S1510930_2494 [Mycobacteroides abscessus subsp. bolletii 1S-151-0930]EIU70545.1 hypothetical protein MM1S1520914_2699 [Mycobacteroides abscessus subsp. bolletii 1S-152-0914]EIU75065.1 hypothetical protein MM1S1530915_2040 [Mycobacteroides abscessus subsp. bolletii 1S-153-0915]EIU80099.1 hypothetical protein MM1S1540310_2052 [Mycobacteroides abscessus subsp. bolletii 1S-154-0310]EIV11610.1 hypothetical protein MM2B0912R_2806 [Mycobacteroides abscessus subsp. bolletii 2
MWPRLQQPLGVHAVDLPDEGRMDAVSEHAPNILCRVSSTA